MHWKYSTRPLSRRTNLLKGWLHTTNNGRNSLFKVRSNIWLTVPSKALKVGYLQLLLIPQLTNMLLPLLPKICTIISHMINLKINGSILSPLSLKRCSSNHKAPTQNSMRRKDLSLTFLPLESGASIKVRKLEAELLTQLFKME